MMCLMHVSCMGMTWYIIPSGVARIWSVESGPPGEWVRGRGEFPLPCEARKHWDYWHFILHRKHVQTPIHVWVDASLLGPLAVFAWPFCVCTWLDLTWKRWVVQVADTARYLSVHNWQLLTQACQLSRVYRESHGFSACLTVSVRVSRSHGHTS